ncbi:ABC transporter permease subunit [Desulfitobacterium sp. THU1]|uniref:ABC transporter permease n=1 Tax=Desulfitobacterium sp. THU1 TaxID=3138072 RepID=UPI00311F5DE9
MLSKFVSRDTLKGYLYLAPALAVILFFFLGGFLIAFVQSLGYFPVIGMEEFTLKYYKEVFQNPEFLESLQYTLHISFISTAIATVFGTALAYFFLKTTPHNPLFHFIHKVPIAVPHLVAALMIVFILSQGGIISRLFVKVGWITETADFPAIFYTQNAIGIILIYIWKEVPFVTLMVYTVMKNIHTKLGEAAATLKASQLQVFCHVILPLSMPSIVSASAIIFAFSFGAFEIPFLLGATYPKTLPVWAYLNFISVDLSARPLAMVINMLVSLVCTVLIFIYYLSMRKYLRKWS